MRATSCVVVRPPVDSGGRTVLLVSKVREWSSAGSSRRRNLQSALDRVRHGYAAKSPKTLVSLPRRVGVGVLTGTYTVLVYSAEGPVSGRTIRYVTVTSFSYGSCGRRSACRQFWRRAASRSWKIGSPVAISSFTRSWRWPWRA